MENKYGTIIGLGCPLACSAFFKNCIQMKQKDTRLDYLAI